MKYQGQSKKIKIRLLFAENTGKQNFIYSNLSKMLAKPRPQSAFRRPMTAVPHQLNEDYPNTITTPTNRKSTLTNLIPDMPAVMQKDKSSTALLYSKFIMKGIKTNKIDLVRNSFNIKKQNLKYDKKMSLKLMKTIKSTRESYNNQPLKSQKNEASSRVQFLQKSQFNPDDSRVLNLEINNFFRVNSNRKPLQQNQTQRKLKNVQSQNMFHPRPQSALNTPQNVPRSLRAQTANHRNVQSSLNRQNYGEYDDFKPSIPDKNLLKIIEIDGPGVKYTNFLQRNKRELSAASKKTSIYLTGVSENNKGEKEIRKISVKKHMTKKSMPDLNELSEFYFPHDQNLLSQKQIAQIQQKSKQNADFMKKSMPNQYKKYVQHIAIQQNNHNLRENQLISINLQQNANEFGEINLNSKNEDEAMEQATDYFNQYAHICEETEYYINKNLKKKEMPKSFNQVLHVGDCQELLELEKERREIELQSLKMLQDQTKKLKQIKERMYQIMKMLSFFKSKSQQVCYKIFSLPFTISTSQQQQTIITRGSKVQHFYVILNGSVIRESRNQSNQQSQTLLIAQPTTSTQVYTNTLFDGETFGEPDNQSQSIHRHEYVAAEKVLLMSLPYLDYKNICSESENIEERIGLLKDIFGSVPGCKALNNQHLQALAFELETCSYEAKQVIFRQQDLCDKLIIVSSGQITKVNQHILKRPKKNSKDMKKKNKSTTKLKLKDHSIQQLRRNNLKNYEVLNENQEEFIFYYQDIVKEFIKGDVINWDGFSHLYRKTLMDQQKGSGTERTILMNKSQINSAQFRLNYSLISNTDNTKIYTLTMNRIQHLPEMLKEVIYAKIDDGMKKERPLKKSKLQKLSQSKPQSSIEKWDQYKQKICNDILSRKLKV